jgi:thiamine-phosphate pyrophosphorylase
MTFQSSKEQLKLKNQTKMAALPFDILVITDHLSCAKVNRTVESTLTALLQSPFSDRVAILVREKVLPLGQVAETLRILQPLTQSVGARLLVHSYLSLALEFGLDGVHFASQVAIAPVRSQLLPTMLLGVSRHSSDPLNDTDIGLANYATISPIYSPTSKPEDHRATLGIEGLQVCVQRSVRPLVALGGMQPGRIAEVMAQGAKAIAISGAILQADDPAMMLTSLCAEIDRSRN